MKLDTKIIRTDYITADDIQNKALQDVIASGDEQLCLFELDDVYTAGTSSNIVTDYIDKSIPLVETGRGGQLTYHGPGQIVAYPILNLNNREKNIRKYIEDLQQWIVNVLSCFDIKAFTTDDVGVWVDTPTGRKKIAAIGIRLRKWVTFHGVALNVSPDLTKFNGIVPCGLSQFGVTSIAEMLGKDISVKDVEHILIAEFDKVFKG